VAGLSTSEGRPEQAAQLRVRAPSRPRSGNALGERGPTVLDNYHFLEKISSSFATR
jgi:catalase